MPYILPCPRDIVSLTEMVDSYCKTPSEVVELISRIRKCTSLVLNPLNRPKLHNFYDALMRRTVQLGEDSTAGRLVEVEHTCIALYEMSHELGGDSVLALWRRYLSEFHSKLTRSLRHDSTQVANFDAKGYSLALGHDWEKDGQWCKWGSAWPSRGEISLLSILGRVFPTSDFRHGVTTPAALLLGQALAQCPVRSSQDLSSGLLAAATMLQHAESAKRVAPEALEFLRSTLFLFASTSDSESRKNSNCVDLNRLMPTFASCGPLSLWLRASLAHTEDGTDEANTIPPLSLHSHPNPSVAALTMIQNMLGEVKSGSKPPSFKKLIASATSTDVTLCRSLLAACLKLVTRAVTSLANSLAFVELFEQIYVAILLVKVPSNDLVLKGLLETTIVSLKGGFEQCSRLRTPLNWQFVSKAENAIKTLAPRFEESYAGVKRSLGAKEEEKRLTKAVKKEEKGAARELKRDSEFLSRVREEERESIKQAAKAGRVKNFGWMEEQQATINLQVRKGRGLAGGGSSIKKSVAAVLKSGKRQS
mmetsp:Transcript_8889/g.11639  ORF Transcript_8889/g.11639 Transcript_8889/m.11639 type:complete len:534 (+) Transcript_8889:569-2170(+)